MQHELLIDGERFTDYDGFVAEFNRAYLAVFGGDPWDGEDFEDFDDFVDHAVKTTGARLTLRWLHSQRSIAVLGHAAMADHWSRSLAGLPVWALSPDTHEFMARRYQESVDQAAADQGRTLFEWLVFQLSDNPDIDLRLE